MARPQVADGGDALQIWRLAAMYGVSSVGQPARSGPPGCGLGVGLTILQLKKRSLLRNEECRLLGCGAVKTSNPTYCYEMLHRVSDLPSN
jgi:hypothetical protein